MAHKHLATRRKYDRERKRRWRAEKKREEKAAAGVLSDKYNPPAPAAADFPDPIDWIQATLIVPSGPLRGQPFTLGDWQQEFISAALADGIYEAGLSCGRKNGKSALIAALLLWFLCGPLSRPDWRGRCVSIGARFALELRTAVCDTARISDLEVTERKAPYPGRVIGSNGSEVEFFSCEKGTGNSVGSDLAIIDEAGLLEDKYRSLWNSMLQSISGRDGKLVAISVQGDSAMFGELRERRNQPGVIFHEYATAPSDDPMDPATWHAANPGLKTGIKSINYMEHAARRAASSSTDLSDFRIYDLNAPGRPDRILLVPMHAWTQVVNSEPRQPAGPVIVGLDLGGSSSMTAAAIFYVDTGLLKTMASLPGIPDLKDRGEADNVADRYEKMRERGELLTYEDFRVTPLRPFLREVSAQVGDNQVICCVADRYRDAELRQALQEAELTWTPIFRGTGWRDASADVRAFQRGVIGQTIYHAPSLLMESAIMESALAIDPAGNEKLDKARSKGRIDAASASVLALGEAERYARPGPDGAMLVTMASHEPPRSISAPRLVCSPPAGTGPLRLPLQ